MDQSLHLAATTGDIDGIIRLREKIDQVTSDKEGRHTVLHLAALSNQSECVSAILNKFPHLLEKPNLRNETALHLSASKGYTDVVNILIQKWRDKDSTAVDLLVKSRGLDSSVVKDLDSEVADKFIKRYKGLDSGDKSWVSAVDFIRKSNVDSNTALHLAVQNNQLKVVEVIVKADRNDTHSQNTDFKTPFYLAINGGYKDMLKIMLENCRNPAAYYGPEGQTILHLAIARRDTEFATLILREKRSLYDVADDKGWTVYHYAAYHNCGSILNNLLDMEESITYKMPAERVPRAAAKITKTTALHIAAYQGHVSIVLDLMRFYINHPVEKKPEDDEFVYTTAEVDEENRNILHMVADQSHKELVHAILQYCPDLDLLLNKKDSRGDTPLHLLIWSGCFVPELIKHERVDRNARNRDNLTPLDLLYIHQDIVAEQLFIRMAFDDIDANQPWYSFFSTFWSKQDKTEIDKLENQAYPSKRRIKEAKFKVAKAEKMKTEVELYRQRTNTQIIVTALITTVTFTVGFTMPGGYHQDEEKPNQGSAVLSKKKVFGVFMIADTIALLLSTASLFLYFISSLYQDAKEVSKLNSASTVLNIVSVVAMMVTFITGTYAVLPYHSFLAITVCVISCLFFVPVILLLVKWNYDPVEKFKV